MEKIFILNSMQQYKVNEIKKIAIENNIPFQFVPKEKLNRLTRKNHQGLIAIASPVSYMDIETFLPGLYEAGKTPFLLILDKVTDVRNIGSIARSAECAGVDAIILPSRGTALLNADAVKTSAGALMKLPVCRNSNLKETIRFLKDSGLKVIAASEKADVQYFGADYKGPVAIIMGSEEKGVSEEYLKLCDEVVKIPIVGEIESLNVSVATGIVIFEAVRQRLNLK